MVTKDESLGRSFFGRAKVDRVKIKGIIVLQKMNSMGFDSLDLAYGVFLWFEACPTLLRVKLRLNQESLVMRWPSHAPESGRSQNATTRLCIRPPQKEALVCSQPHKAEFWGLLGRFE
jgi:hypothetical protein